MPLPLDGSSHIARSTRLALVAVVVLASLLVFVPKAFAVTFDPNHIISDYRMRNYRSMSEQDIQSFLDAQPGMLKSLVANDYAGTPKRASAIIYEACQQWHVSPKVMLTMLQKEQSLLTRTSVPPITLERAIGAGCPNDVDNRYPGFGPQIWNGARMLDGYGEGKTTAYVPLWTPGMTCSAGADGRVTPANLATYKLYVYNPSLGATAPYGDLSSQADHLRGNASFWNIYRRYFGDPLAPPPAPRPKPKPKPKAAPKPKAKPKPRVKILARRICRYDGRYFLMMRTSANPQPTYRFYEPPAPESALARWARETPRAIALTK